MPATWGAMGAVKVGPACPNRLTGVVPWDRDGTMWLSPQSHFTAAAKEVSRTMASTDWDDYLRHEAAMYRQLADQTENVCGKQELLDLAAVCEEVANSIEDRLTGG
jgi:hypothetical protein